MDSESTVDRRTGMTRGQLLALPTVLRGGFRPFWLLGPLWAIVVAGLWVEAMAGAITLPTAFDPLAWHRHEMLFGYLGAVIAGFLLTAIPNWTGRLPIAGARLAALSSLWLAARLAILFSSKIGGLVAMAIDVAFLLVLAGVCGREVLIARNRNMPVVGVILLFAIASAIDHAEALGWLAGDGLGWRGAFALVLILIALIGGRIIPSFTRNWLVKQGRVSGLPTQPGRFDLFSIAVLVAALFAWVAGAGAGIAGPLLLAAGAVHFVRMMRWSGYATTAEPLVFILHLSYFWLPLGLILLGMSLLVPTQPASAALHALGAGAMGSMTIAVMTRATLGHTGRELRADGGTGAIYLLVTLGAASRVASPWLPFDYLLLIRISAVLWTGAFLLFLILYGPKLLRPRLDGRP